MSTRPLSVAPISSLFLPPPPPPPTSAIYSTGIQSEVKPPGMDLSVISTLSGKHAVNHIVPFVHVFYRRGGNGKNSVFGSGSGGICAIVADEYISSRLTC